MFIFKWLFKLLERLWNLIKKVLPVIMLGLALYLVAIGPLAIPFLGLTLSGTTAALALAGASFLIAPGETADVVSRAAEGIGDVASTVAVEAGDAIGSLVSSTLSSSSIISLVAGGLLLWWLVTKKDKKKEKEVADGKGGYALADDR